MNSRYILKDAILRQNTRYNKIKVESNSSPILHIFRLISGTTNLYDNHTDKTYKFRDNFLKLTFQKHTTLNQNNIIEEFPAEITLRDLNKYFDKAKTNIKFYNSIKTELIKCLIALESERFLESFFYLYRILEGISYSLPLIYISKKNDYNKTYSDLQSYFGKDRDGELSFFKRFISETFGKELFYNSTIDIDMFELHNAETRADYYTLYIQKLKEKAIVSKVENENIKIKFIGFYDFIIELRNRFFHNAKGSWQENFESNELIYPDMFFKPIIKNGVNWFALILFEIIKVDLSKVQI